MSNLSRFFVPKSFFDWITSNQSHKLLRKCLWNQLEDQWLCFGFFLVYKLVIFFSSEKSSLHSTLLDQQLPQAVSVSELWQRVAASVQGKTRFSGIVRQKREYKHKYNGIGNYCFLYNSFIKGHINPKNIRWIEKHIMW